MVELFKGSSQQDRVILSEQVSSLERLNQVELAKRDAAWRAARDFALSAARDTIRRVLPANSALYDTYVKSVGEPSQPAEHSDRIDVYELSLYRVAVDNVTWESTSNAPGSPPPVVSKYSEINKALPELIYRHWTFKVIMAGLVALAGFAVFGVFKFYGLTVDVQQQLDEKQAALSANFDKQRRDIETVLASRRKEGEEIAARVSELALRSSRVSDQLKHLQDDARDSIAKLTNDAASDIKREAAKRMPTLRKSLDDAQTDAVTAVSDASKERVRQVLALDGGKAFQDKVQEFNTRAVKAIDDLGALEQRQKILDARQQVLGTALKLLDNPSAGFADLLAVYFNLALWVVYGAATAMIVLILFNVALLIMWVRSKVRK